MMGLFPAVVFLLLLPTVAVRQRWGATRSAAAAGHGLTSTDYTGPRSIAPLVDPEDGAPPKRRRRSDSAPAPATRTRRRVGSFDAPAGAKLAEASAKAAPAKNFDVSVEEAAPAKNFVVSVEEARRFVNVVGGVQRFSEMLGAMSPDGGTEMSADSEAPRLAEVASSAVSTASIPVPSTERKGRLISATATSNETARDGKLVDDENLHRDIVTMFNAYVPTRPGGKFREFSLSMLENPITQPIFAKWTVTGRAVRFMKENLRISAVRVRMFQDFVQASTSGKSGDKFDPVLRGKDLADRADIFAVAQRCVSRELAPFNFTVPNKVGQQSAQIAQVQAHVLVTTGKFFATCRDSAGEMKIRVLRFRAKHVDGRHAVEARFLGSDEKYPVLQPWVVLGRHGGLDFLGIRGQAIQNLATELYTVMPHLPPKQALPGGLVFSLGFQRQAPVIVVRELYRVGAQMKCVAATSPKRLEDFANNFEETLPFKLEEYIEYLDARS